MSDKAPRPGLLSRLGTRPRSRSTRPVCRITVDLRRLSWQADPVETERRLRQAPGVTDVKINQRRQRAVLYHDAQASLPRLWDWLQAQGWRP